MTVNNRFSELRMPMRLVWIRIILLLSVWDNNYSDGFLFVPIPQQHSVVPSVASCSQRLQQQQQVFKATISETLSAKKSSTLYSTTEESNTVLTSSDSEPVDNISKPPVEEGSQDELMYALGVNLARQLGDVTPLVESGQELAQVAKGLLDTVIGRLTDEGQQALLLRRGDELNAMIVARAKKIKDRLEQAGREMLDQMAATEGAQRLESGVVFQILEDGPSGKGRGVRPTKSSTVKIHYHGTLADGTIFDSTYAKGEPVKFPLAAVIPGWREGVLKMHEGETAMVGIPPEQAYGEAGTPDGSIPGGSTLFFKIQLIEVMSAGIGGDSILLGADGTKLSAKKESSSFLLGADGKPL